MYKNSGFLFSFFLFSQQLESGTFPSHCIHIDDLKGKSLPGLFTSIVILKPKTQSISHEFYVDCFVCCHLIIIIVNAKTL